MMSDDHFQFWVNCSFEISLFVSLSVDESCMDLYYNCVVVVQAHLCVYSYYRTTCCASCSRVTQRDTLHRIRWSGFSWNVTPLLSFSELWCPCLIMASSPPVFSWSDPEMASPFISTDVQRRTVYIHCPSFFFNTKRECSMSKWVFIANKNNRASFTSIVILSNV